MAYQGQAPDYGGHIRAKSNVESQYGNQSASNAYGRFLGQQRYERSAGDSRRQFGRSYAPKKASFGRRGLSGGGIKSGAMMQSMGRYASDYGREQMRMSQNQTQANQGYDMQQANLDQWKQQELQAIEDRKANEIAWTGQNLNEIRSSLGY
jgi:hypothetical protein